MSQQIKFLNVKEGGLVKEIPISEGMTVGDFLEIRNVELRRGQLARIYRGDDKITASAGEILKDGDTLTITVGEMKGAGSL